VYFSLLPLAHIYEFGVQIIMVAQGASIGFSSGSTQNLTDDLAALQPTIICGVPRLWNRIVGSMKERVNALPKALSFLVNYCIGKHLGESLILRALIFKRFAAALGGRVRLIVNGGAPIHPDVYEFLRSAICPNICQGYGLTEVSASVSVSAIPDHCPSSNGPPSLTADLKLRRIDGFNCDPRGIPPTGEVLVKGPQVFRGYYRNEALTKEVLDAEGWFATGDIVRINSDGCLEVIDRVKQLVKLSQGEYISVTTLTEIYGSTAGVASVYVYADSFRDRPIAAVVPSSELVEEWKSNGIEVYIGNKRAEEWVVGLLGNTADKNELRSFERIDSVLLDSDEFSIENGLLTPAMKPQWTSLRKKYEALLLRI
jgi:long-chain acyl-CoA synthetase